MECGQWCTIGIYRIRPSSSSPFPSWHLNIIRTFHQLGGNIYFNLMSVLPWNWLHAENDHVTCPAISEYFRLNSKWFIVNDLTSDDYKLLYFVSEDVKHPVILKRLYYVGNFMKNSNLIVKSPWWLHFRDRVSLYRGLVVTINILKKRQRLHISLFKKKNLLEF